MILGYDRLDEATVGTHHTCRLGKWVDDNECEDPEAHRKIAEMEKPHEQLHKLAKEAISAYNRGDLRKAEEILVRMDDASHQVVGYLEQIKEIAK